MNFIDDNGNFNKGDILYGLALQPDGKILATGETTPAQVDVDGLASRGGYVAQLVRYNADSSLDTTFGSGGIRNFNYYGQWANGVIVQPDGKLLLSGGSRGSENTMRLNSDGSFDNSYGTGGQTLVDFGT